MTDKLKGLIFYSKNIKDNDLFIKILSSKDEVNQGIVYGGNSSKKKLIYQKGYFIDYSLFQKNTNIELNKSLKNINYDYKDFKGLILDFRNNRVHPKLVNYYAEKLGILNLDSYDFFINNPVFFYWFPIIIISVIR